MYPERLPADAPRSEAVVYEALRQTLSADFVVFHSIPWHVDARNHPDGEADFLVAHADLGLMVLEVKGGGIEWDGSSGECRVWMGARDTGSTIRSLKRNERSRR